MRSEKHIARLITVFAWSVAIALFLLIGVRFLISTEWALGIIEEKIKAELNEELNADTEIARVSGDAWNNLTIEEFEIKADEFKISIKKLTVNYVLIDLILGDPLVESLHIDGVNAHIDIDKAENALGGIQAGENPEAVSTFIVDQIQILNGDFHLISNRYLPDTLISVNELAFFGDLKIGDKSSLGINDLNFQINHGRLPEAISLGLDGEISNEAISLNDLILGIGESVVEGALNADLFSNNITGLLAAETFKVTDLISDVSPNFDFSKLKLELELEGTLNEFGITLKADGDQIQNLELKTDIQWNQGPQVQSIYLFADFFNSSNLIDSVQIVGGPFEVNMSGNLISIDTSSDFEWSAGISNLEINKLHFEHIKTKGALENGSTSGYLELLSASGETLKSDINIDSVFSAEPNWNVDYFIQNFNPNRFNEDFVSGDINASGRITGNSYAPLESQVDITIQNQHPETGEKYLWEIGEDWINEIDLYISVGKEKLISEGFIRVLSSEIEIEIQAYNPFDIKSEYTYQANFKNLDIGNLSMFEGNSTSLTGGLYGIGNGRTPENASIFGSLSLQNGQINNANIDSFDASVQYEYGMLTIREGNLKSDIADGEITGQRDLMDVTNPENRLNLNLNLKNLQPLTGLFGLTALEANGQLDGVIQQDAEGLLTGEFDLNLINVLVDSVFTADEVIGTSNVQIESQRIFEANLEIVRPLIQGLVLQDILMKTNGALSQDSLIADFEITVIGSERGRLAQEGSIRKNIVQKLSDIQFTRFDFISKDSDLLLQRPFNVRIFQSEFGTDTLNLSSDAGAFLEFSIPFFSETEALAFVTGDNFDIGLIQDIVFGERFIDGILSGEINYHQTPGDVLGNGLTRIDQLSYKGAEADSLIVSFDIINERLDARGNVYWDSTLAVSGWANVPFVIEKNELDEEFYNRPVRGKLDIIPTDLSKFEQILSDIGIENTTGIISINGGMSGEAGSPQFTGTIEVDDPILSGIPVDRISAEFDYLNQSNRLIIQSEIFARNTPVAEFSIAYPLEYDFRTLELYLPDSNDELEIKAVTNDLNIAIFNDFVDPNYISNLDGILNVDLQFSGPLGNIKPDGFLNIRGGNLRVPYSGIQLKNMIMQMNIDSTKLEISNFYAESGQGRLFSSGTATLNGIFPQEISMIIDANLFELVKTREMNLIVDLNTDLEGNITNPFFTGNATVRRGFYMLTNFGEESIEEIILEDEEIASFSPYDSLNIDLEISFPRNFYVRSRDYLDMEVEPKGSINFYKEKATEPKVFGVLSIDDGYIRPLGKQFKVENGALTFIEDVENPELEIQSSYVPQTRQKGESVLLYYNINGTRNEPEFSFGSDPVMEQEDVICYTLFNKPCYSLESWQSVFADANGAQAFQAISDILLDEVENLATRQLGVDVVQIDNSGQNGRTAITTGWYLNERTFFSIINELTSSTPKTLFVLEYLLSENWDLIITQGEDSRQGIDVRYQFDY